MDWFVALDDPQFQLFRVPDSYKKNLLQPELYRSGWPKNLANFVDFQHLVFLCPSPTVPVAKSLGRQKTAGNSKNTILFFGDSKMKYLSLATAIVVALAINSSSQAQEQRAIGGGKINPQEQIDKIQEGQQKIPTAGTVQPPIQGIPQDELGARQERAIVNPGAVIDSGLPGGEGLPAEGILPPELGQTDLGKGKPAANLQLGKNSFLCTELGCQGRIVDNGLQILDVRRGGIAKRLGLQVGDCLSHINGVEISSLDIYNQCLLDAGRLHDGWLNIRVKDIRFDYGYKVPEYTFVRAYIGGGLNYELDHGHGSSCNRRYEAPIIYHNVQRYPNHSHRVYRSGRSCGGSRR